MSGGYLSGGGFCPAGICPGGICPGGICPAGICPDTYFKICLHASDCIVNSFFIQGPTS